MYRYFQTLSVDIVLGACAGLLFFDRLLNADLNLIVYVLLGLAVWCIYTFDHLLDARQIGKRASTLRHAFHQRHFWILTIILFLMGCLGFYLAFRFLQIKSIVYFGSALGLLIVLIFLLLKLRPHKWVFIKEISIATFYVGGIMLAPFFNHLPEKIPSFFWLLGLGYILLAWFNTVYLGMLDRDTDKKDGLSSLALVLGENSSVILLRLLLAGLLIYLISLYGFLNSSTYLYISLLLLMALIHGIAFLQGERNHDTIRKKLDASFMLPFLLLLV